MPTSSIFTSDFLHRSQILKIAARSDRSCVHFDVYCIMNPCCPNFPAQSSLHIEALQPMHLKIHSLRFNLAWPRVLMRSNSMPNSVRMVRWSFFTIPPLTAQPMGRVILLKRRLQNYAALDAGSSFSDKFPGEKIPLLEEVFEAVGKKTFINIELKNYTTPHDQLVEKVCALVAKTWT